MATQKLAILLNITAHWSTINCKPAYMMGEMFGENEIGTSKSLVDCMQIPRLALSGGK